MRIGTANSIALNQTKSDFGGTVRQTKREQDLSDIESIWTGSQQIRKKNKRLGKSMIREFNKLHKRLKSLDVQISNQMEETSKEH